VGDTDQSEEETEEPEGAKARLFGMVVREVSFVDRPANKRPFLLTKKDRTMAKGKTAVAKGPEQGAAEGAAAAAGAAPGGGADGAGAPTQGGTGTDAASSKEKLPALQPQVKDALVAALSSLAEKIVDVADQVKGADSDPKAAGPAVPESVLKALGEASQMMTSLIAQYGGQPANAGATKDLEGQSENGGVTSQGAQKATKDPDDEDLEKRLRAVVAKAGRKMAKERLSRLNSAISSLSQIARELKTEKLGKSAGAAVVPPAFAGLEKELAEITSALEEITKAEESGKTEIAELRVKCADLEKRVGPRNSGEPDGGSTIAPRAVSWPMDMSRPIAPRGPATDFAAPRR
jgi:hypothetical protein